MHSEKYVVYVDLLKTFHMVRKIRFSLSPSLIDL